MGEKRSNNLGQSWVDWTPKVIVHNLNSCQSVKINHIGNENECSQTMCDLGINYNIKNTPWHHLGEFPLSHRYKNSETPISSVSVLTNT